MASQNQDAMFSIVLPTYNVAKHIDRCIESCLAQDYQNLEVIVVDDCGSDDSVERARWWADQDNRVRIISNKRNLGTYHSRRRGVEAAKGDYVVFLDPDDELSNNAISEMGRIVIKDEIDFFFYTVVRVPSVRTRWRGFKLPKSGGSANSLTASVLKSSVNYGTPGKVYSTKLLSSIINDINVPEGLRLIYAEDLILFFGALVKASSYMSLPSATYRYHCNDTSISNMLTDASIIEKCKQIDVVTSIINKSADLLSKKHSITHVDDAKKMIVNYAQHNKYQLLCQLRSQGRGQYIQNAYFSFKNRNTVMGGLRIILALVTLATFRI